MTGSDYALILAAAGTALALLGVITGVALWMGRRRE